MVLVLDPSMLGASRVGIWLNRLHRDAPELLPYTVSSVRSCAGQEVNELSEYSGGMWPRPLRIVREAAYLRPLFADGPKPLTEESMAAELLMAVSDGHTLVCRKTAFLEFMLDSGAKLYTSRPSLKVWEEVVNELPDQHRDSFRRRVRLIVRIDAADPARILRVYDSGSYGQGWR